MLSVRSPMPRFDQLAKPNLINYIKLVLVGNKDLLKSSLAVSHASFVAITIMSTMDDNTTSGVIALTRMLQALGKRVDLLATQTQYNEQAKIVEELVEKSM